MTRFDLEDQISSLFSVSDDLVLLSNSVLEDTISKDEIANILIGLSGIVNLRRNQLFDTMKQIFQLDEYNGSLS
jgi:hypothetical protein